MFIQKCVWTAPSRSCAGGGRSPQLRRTNVLGMATRWHSDCSVPVSGEGGPSQEPQQGAPDCWAPREPKGVSFKCSASSSLLTKGNQVGWAAVPLHRSTWPTGGQLPPAPFSSSSYAISTCVSTSLMHPPILGSGDVETDEKRQDLGSEGPFSVASPGTPLEADPRVFLLSFVTSEGSIPPSPPAWIDFLLSKWASV